MVIGDTCERVSHLSKGVVTLMLRTAELGYETDGGEKASFVNKGRWGKLGAPMRENKVAYFILQTGFIS